MRELEMEMFFTSSRRERFVRKGDDGAARYNYIYSVCLGWKQTKFVHK